VSAAGDGMAAAARLHAVARRAVRAALAAAAALALGAAAADARWTRVEAVPAAEVWSVFARDDTVLAGVERGVWVSADAGATWERSADLPVAGSLATAVRFERGRLWAGTYGQGVYVSDDLGATWQPLSQGLAGGIGNSHLYINDFETRGDSLLAATDGAGVFALSLGAPAAWAPLGTGLVTFTTGGVPDMGVAQGRIVACSGANGEVFLLDRGHSAWVPSSLTNGVPAPGLQAWGAVWTGSAWLVATSRGCFRSADGAQPWTDVSPSVGPRTDSQIAASGGVTWAAYNSLYGVTRYVATADDGATWHTHEEPFTFTTDLALSGGLLWAARGDGLWTRAAAPVAAPPPSPPAVSLERVGPHPARGVARLRFALAAAGPARLSVFDAAGREVARLADGPHAAGAHEVAWASAGAPPGVYFARLATPAGAAALRLVHLR